MCTFRPHSLPASARQEPHCCSKAGAQCRSIVGRRIGCVPNDWARASHARANITFNTIYHKLARMPRAKVVMLCVLICCIVISDHGTDPDRPDLQNITNPRRPHQEHPLIRHMKVAHVRRMVLMVVALCADWAGHCAASAAGGFPTHQPYSTSLSRITIAGVPAAHILY